MDQRIALWNVLHDGEITAISQQGGDLTMFVSIPYLRRRLAPLGDSFVLTLKGVRLFEFRNFDNTPDPQQLELGSPEILGTDSDSVPVSIDTTLGKLVIDFDSVGLATDTGQAVTFETVNRIAEEYWSEWKARTAKARET